METPERYIYISLSKGSRKLRLLHYASNDDSPNIMSKSFGILGTKYNTLIAKVVQPTKFWL